MERYNTKLFLLSESVFCFIKIYLYISGKTSGNKILNQRGIRKSNKKTTDSRGDKVKTSPYGNFRNMNRCRDEANCAKIVAPPSNKRKAARIQTGKVSRIQKFVKTQDS